ncbi:MAG: ADP-ribosylglycohydrolase family protein [Xanthobacteraceae bacterium]
MDRSRYRGCLLGGAVGDALGAPVEFLSHGDIVARFGAAGIADFAPAYGRVGAITDDTQMTLFTAEGLLRALVRGRSKGIVHIPSIVDVANLRWLSTQGIRPQANAAWESSWLYAEPALHERRAPGTTCLTALAEKTSFGQPAKNTSKGCGTAMKTAPIGLLLSDRPDNDLFELACEVAALTHGHPLGIVPAGWLTVLIAGLVRGLEFDQALAMSNAATQASDAGHEFLHQIEHARLLARKATRAPESIEIVGGGWTADEAVAIAVFAVDRADDFTEAVLTAANHSGDSDSTAAIAGNIYGAMAGTQAIPEHWITRLELNDVITRLADDLYDFGPFGERRNDIASLELHYPGF